MNTPDPIEGQDAILRHGTPAGEPPMLDTLASFARTALDDPQSIGLGDEYGAPQVPYAIERLDDIIEALNPSTETLDTFAGTLTMLGRHLAERADYMEATDWYASERDRVQRAIDYLHAALNDIDQAIHALRGASEPPTEEDIAQERDEPYHYYELADAKGRPDVTHPDTITESRPDWGPDGDNPGYDR